MTVIDFLEEHNIYYEKKIDLTSKTWIKRGGIADVWIQPLAMNVFEEIIIWCQSNGVEFEIIGNASNCYFTYIYNPKIVISTLKLNKMTKFDHYISCECGVNISKFSKFCNNNGFSGYEGLIGLPGTVGGAAVNNAGCYGSVMEDLVLSVVVLQGGKKRVLNNDELKYKYRNSIIKSKEIQAVVCEVNFNTSKKEDPIKLKFKVKKFQLLRKNTQQNALFNLGTTFYGLKFKRLPFFLNMIYYFLKGLIKIIVFDNVKRQKINTKLFHVFYATGEFKKYISDYNIGCFVWKDDYADKAFLKYLSFLKKQSIEGTMEIEIK
tara:strand:- start:14048 stop:15007 length:960 start_codon:yes stop_codon:yes gene_type:complete